MEIIHGILTTYAKLPKGFYFDPNTGGFTLMFWIKINMMGLKRPELLSFKKDENQNQYLNHMFFGFYASTSKLYFGSMSGGLFATYFTQNSIPFNTWTHVAVRVDNFVVSVYFDGVSQPISSEYTNDQANIRTDNRFFYKNIIRDFNYFGKNERDRSMPFNFILYDLKIFDGPLQNENIILEKDKTDNHFSSKDKK